MSLLSKCACCRHNLLRLFVSLAGVPNRSALKPRKNNLSLNAFDPPIPIRTFSIISPRRSDSAHEESILRLKVQEEKTLDAATELDQEITEPFSQQPWYLQVETPQRKLRSLSERQQLPELPPDPPPLLQPILEHISNDLGLDELSLFDLRKLDPPHALGANLLIILGTARSEKHLHVSADRFCRWLRTTHKLTPYADGLMGRGELKLKTRRKARRARILSRVGSSERYSQDDGLTTGWICVNVGTIEDGKGDLQESLEPEGFVGFGEKAGGTAVVIQMLTEDKRMELDLEELWENTLKNHEGKEAKMKLSSGAAINDDLSDHNYLQEQNLSSNPSSILLSNQQKSSVGNYRQRREFHSSASHLELKSNFISVKPSFDTLHSDTLNSKPSFETPHFDTSQPDTLESSKPNFISLKPSFDTLQSDTLNSKPSFDTPHFDTSEPDTLESSKPNFTSLKPSFHGPHSDNPSAGRLAHLTLQDSSLVERFEAWDEPQPPAYWRLRADLDMQEPELTYLGYVYLDAARAWQKPKFIKVEKPGSVHNVLDLKANLDYLRSLDSEDALEVLGSGINDWGSTSFLASFYKSYPLFPAEDHWECRFAMVCHAIRIGHPKYHKRNLMRLINQMRASIDYVPFSIIILVIDTLLTRYAPLQDDQTTGMSYLFDTQDFKDSLMLLDGSRIEELEISDDDVVVRNKILMTLYVATAFATDFPLGLKSDVNVQLRLYMDLFDIEVTDTGTHLTVLKIFALKNNWEAFWSHWNGIAGRLQSKPAALYALMFHYVAETGSQIQCIDALRERVPEMGLEEPPVRMEGQVAMAVSECLDIVAPNIKAGLAKSGWFQEVKWDNLRRRCNLALNIQTSHPAPKGAESDESDNSEYESALVPWH